MTVDAATSAPTVLVGSWTGEFDRARADAVLSGAAPFDETSFNDDPHASDDGPADRTHLAEAATGRSDDPDPARPPATSGR
jgi:aerobic C4-dicarboxylate transport protein